MKLKHEGTTINMAGIPEGAILVVDRGEPCEEWITVEGMISPVVDYKTNKVIKPGKLLGVKRGKS